MKKHCVTAIKDKVASLLDCGNLKSNGVRLEEEFVNIVWGYIIVK